MILAKELLQKNETTVVLEYFDLCGEFWDMGQEQLMKWEEIVSKKEIPNFGANLVY